MPLDTAQIGADARPKVRLLTLADLDKRTTAAKRAATLIKKITGDLGGQDQLATGEQQIIQRAAFLGVLAEDVESRWLLGEDIDATVLATIANAQRRLLESVGLKRVPRNVTPSVAEYIDSVNAE
jgi:hypothetical protein